MASIDTSSFYSSYFAQTAQNTLSTSSTSSLESSLSSISEDTDDDTLLEACKSFETYLVEQVYKEMENSVKQEDEDENEYLSYFGDTLIEEYAKATTESGSLGLAQKLYDSIKNNG